MSHKIYSIESRKGGVGKTTVALNLAITLLAKREPVLLLDCDITGTSIVDPAKNSPFWNKDTNVLAYIDKDGKEKDINLLEFFLKQFIKGEGNVRSIIKPERLQTGKVNVIGSSLYGTPQEAAINMGWLMDELHSYWLVEFVQQIIREFESIYAEKTVHVIIDNSPGYTSFNNSLHGYMYDEGPDISKFLLVSTLDSQDLQANMEAAVEIDKSISSRTIVANYYILKENDEDDEKRDAQVEALIERDDDVKEFFFNLIENKVLLEHYVKKYKTENYLALVLNKVPQSLEDDGSIVEFDEIVDERIDLLYKIVGAGREMRPQNIIYYDEAIVYQYYLRYLRGRTGMRPVNAVYWSRRLREIRQQVEETSKLRPMAAMTKLNTYFEGLQTSLNQRGYAQIARQMVRAWSPIFAIEGLKAGLSNTVARRLYDTAGTPSQKMKEMLLVWNTEQLHELQIIMEQHTSDYVVLSDLIEYLQDYAGVREERRRPELMLSVSLLLYAFKISYREWSQEDKDLREFCSSEHRNHIRDSRWAHALNSTIEVNQELKLNVRDIQRFLGFDVERLYNDFCYTLLRLIDQKEDFLFLLDAISLFVPSNPSRPLSKEMTEYVSDVIYRKKWKKDEKKLTEIRANSYVMKNMQDVLRDNILKVWK